MPIPDALPVEPSGPRRLGRCKRTAHFDNTPLGWAEITHPFHPLRGQRFQVLKKKLIAGVEVLSLRKASGGVYPIAREWTSLADPSPYAALGIPPPILDFECLFDLLSMLEEMDQRKKKGVDK